MGVTLLFIEKIWRPYFAITSESDYLFSYRLLTTPIFSRRQRRLSSVLSKFSHEKINFRSGVTFPGGVIWGGPPSPLLLPLVTPLFLVLIFAERLSINVVAIDGLLADTYCVVCTCISAGVGRTGAVIVIDAMLERIKHEKTLDVYGHVTITRNSIFLPFILCPHSFLLFPLFSPASKWHLKSS